MSEHGWISVILLLALVGATLFITWRSSRRVKADVDFYAAGRSILGWQNGLAIAGEFMAAAALLGIAGLIVFYGIDGQIYSLGWVGSFLILLLLVAEPVRNIGKYTFADVVSFRLSQKVVRPQIALTTVVVSLTYLVPQMVAAGVLSRLLFGIPPAVGILIVGTLMTVYIAFGGMLAATWIQFLKAVMLIACGYGLAIAALAKFGFSLDALFTAVITDPQLGGAWLEPGGWLASPWERFSLGLSLLFGTAALPHVVMRFYTVPDKKHARASASWSLTFMTMFHVLTFIFGFAAAVLVGGEAVRALDPGGNLATPMLAEVLGGGADSFGGALAMSVIVVVAFMTIVAAVSGLCLSAAASFSYDFWFHTVRRGRQSPKAQVRTARTSALVIGAMAVAIALALSGANVAYLSGLAFAMAATVNLPTLVLSLHWKRLTTAGASIGIVGGAVVSVLAVVLGPQVMGAGALFPLANPGLITIPIGFGLTIVGSLLTRDAHSQARFAEVLVRSNTGIGKIEAVSAH